MAAVPAAAPGVEEGGARRLTGLFRHALPRTLDRASESYGLLS
jgi:hypothetical protein